MYKYNYIYMEYICPNCNKDYCQKSNLDRHLNKKKPCVRTNNILNLAHDSTQNTLKNTSKTLKNTFNVLENSKNNKLNDLEVKNNDFKETNEDNEIKCGYCQAYFSRKTSLKRHLDNYCKAKKQQDDEREEIFQQLLLKDSIIKEKDQQINNIIKHKDEQINKILEQNHQLICQIEKLAKLGIKSSSHINSGPKTKSVQQAETINNNISNNNISNNNSTNTSNTSNTSNTNNIVLFNFGKEDLGIIDTKQYINRVIKNNITGVKIPEEILKLIHFNPAYPQLSNIYISDINREKCMVYEDNQWKLSPVDKIPEVIDRVVEYSYNRDEELREIFKNNKPVLERLNVINKYVKMNDTGYLELLKEAIEEEQFDNSGDIKRCAEFNKKTYDTFKTTMYNEGKNIKSKN